jgi:YCII-related domain
MRFMILLKGDPAPGQMPDPELIDAMIRYNEELAKAGVLLAAEGLLDSSKGTRVIYSAGQRRVVDGPFTADRVGGGCSTGPPPAPGRRGGSAATRRSPRRRQPQLMLVNVGGAEELPRNPALTEEPGAMVPFHCAGRNITVVPLWV